MEGRVPWHDPEATGRAWLGDAGYEIERSVKRPPDELVGPEFGVSR